MPELPEVETVMRGLMPYMVGQQITHVAQNRPNLRVPFPPGLTDKLVDQKILSLNRRGKYFMLNLGNNYSVIVHLGMSGSFKIYTDNMLFVPQKHDHFILTLASKTRVVFNDPRRFGMVLYHPSKDLDRHKAFINMGVEPLDLEFNGVYLHRSFQSTSSPIKTALLDQRIVAGLGNIYVCEALYLSGINPKTKAHKVSLKRCHILVNAIKAVLIKAIEAGGSSLKDHRQADGQLGYFQHQFSVYGKQGKACPDCDCEIERTHGIKRIIQAGRSTFYCPRKQR